MVTLADAIIEEDIYSVRQLLQYGEKANQLDEYGFTPLVEAAIVDNIEITQLLLQAGANPNQQDVTGGTPLQWATENNNLDLCKLLLEHRADPNAYNFSGQPILVMPMLRQQKLLTQLLYQYGADQVFAQDFINTKLLGHSYELVGTGDIVDPHNHFVEVDFEGFFLEVTIGLIADSVHQFQNHYAARQLRRYGGIVNLIVDIMLRASQLIKYQQYRVNLKKYKKTIENLIKQEPLIIPLGYEGHAITFVKYGDILAKCDRREESRLYDNIMYYRVKNPQTFNVEFIKHVLYEKLSDEFVNVELPSILNLQPLTELRVEAQVSGNCSWANVEACIPTLFFLILTQMDPDPNNMAHFKTLALNFFHRWREWNKDRVLQFLIQSFKKSDSIRKACKAEILAAILFQYSNMQQAADKQRLISILEVLSNSPCAYVLQNYLRVYYYMNPTEEGKRFAQLLKEYGYLM